MRQNAVAWMGHAELLTRKRAFLFSRGFYLVPRAGYRVYAPFRFGHVIHGCRRLISAILHGLHVGIHPCRKSTVDLRDRRLRLRRQIMEVCDLVHRVLGMVAEAVPGLHRLHKNIGRLAHRP